jgi:AcrR family transcriptional regulator
MNAARDGRSGEPPAGNARARAAQTKRLRTRAALLHAADLVFGTRGWNDTRVEDVAATAGVSAATAYNHFPSKHALIGRVYEPMVRSLITQADQARDSGRPVIAALREQITALTRMSFRNRGLTTALWFAIQDYAATRPGGAPDPGDEDDPRIVVPLPDVVGGLLLDGQESGELRTYPPADEMSALVANTLLIRSVNRPHEPPEQTAELILTLVLGALRPQDLAATERDERPFRSDG